LAFGSLASGDLQALGLFRLHPGEGNTQNPMLVMRLGLIRVNSIR
jgi:hypothetical protein